jgi:hypothetical protein
VLIVLAVRLWPSLLGTGVPDGAEREATLALAGALVAAVVAGVLDHYFFNITFSHMVALFWGTAALAVVAARLTSMAAPEPVGTVKC